MNFMAAHDAQKLSVQAAGGIHCGTLPQCTATGVHTTQHHLLRSEAALAPLTEATALAAACATACALAPLATAWARAWAAACSRTARVVRLGS